jgi:3-oxoacyl-[acyl-carrier-protein] synthase-3
MIPKAQIASLASILPENKLLSTELEKQINQNSKNILMPSGIIEILTGVKERRIAGDNKHASDLATQAALLALNKTNLKANDIDCLIFAAASGDITEPATANIVQENLKIHCPVFDIKNACNSFMNGMEVAESFIISGKYKSILIVNGEIPSRAVRKSVDGKDQLRRSFAGYTLGDAGAAMIITPSDGKRGILYSQFRTYGEHWRQSAVLGGGTRFPRDFDKSYFEGETSGLKDIFIKIGPQQIFETLQIVGWTLRDIDKIVVHQVSLKSFDLLIKVAKLPKEKLVIVLPEFGNMVSASIPVALDQVQQKGELHEGDKILLLGLAAGVSIATMALIW